MLWSMPWQVYFIIYHCQSVVGADIRILRLYIAYVSRIHGHQKT